MKLPLPPMAASGSSAGGYARHKIFIKMVVRIWNSPVVSRRTQALLGWALRQGNDQLEGVAWTFLLMFGEIAAELTGVARMLPHQGP